MSLNRMPRPHHYGFSHRLFPRELFKAPQRIVQELLGEGGGTFLFYLWEELGKSVEVKLKAVEAGCLPGSNPNEQLLKLDVLGTAQQGDNTLIIVSLPPTRFPGEAMFVAVVQEGSKTRYFTYERSSGVPALGDDPDTAWLGELRADRSRVSHGGQRGTDARSFTRALCAVLELKFDPTWRQVLDEETPAS